MKPNPISKIAKQLAFVRASARLRTPCGCPVGLKECHCPREHCVCDLDLEFCECASEWPAEFLIEIGKFLEQMDPDAYADRPLARKRILAVAHESRLSQYEARAESGEALFHPGDCRPEARKNGELLRTARNGVVGYMGAGAAPQTRCRSAWRARSRIVSSTTDEPMNVEDLVAASENMANDN